MIISRDVPALYLYVSAYDYVQTVVADGCVAVNMESACGLPKEDQIFNELALFASFIKLVCSGSELMIPVIWARTLRAYVISTAGEANQEKGFATLCQR